MSSQSRAQMAEEVKAMFRKMMTIKIVSDQKKSGHIQNYLNPGRKR